MTTTCVRAVNVLFYYLGVLFQIVWIGCFSFCLHSHRISLSTFLFHRFPHAHEHSGILCIEILFILQVYVYTYVYAFFFFFQHFFLCVLSLYTSLQFVSFLFLLAEISHTHVSVNGRTIGGVVWKVSETSVEFSFFFVYIVSVQVPNFKLHNLCKTLHEINK